MLASLAKRLLLETDWRCLLKFAGGFGVRGGLALRRARKRARRGEFFPPFWFLSITSACNLRCQGCWAVTDGPPRELGLDAIDRIVSSGKRQGVHFYGLLGGEPLLHGGLMDVLARHRDCYFQLFTNGTLLTDTLAREFRRLGNVTPLVSIEGLAATSDERRGGRDVYARTLAGLDACRRHRLITGAASSLCKSNLDELLTRHHLDGLVERGVHYAWFYLYRPSGPEPHPELALSADEVARVRRFLVEARTRSPMLIVDAYWDEAGRALCPAAAGVSLHIGPGGDIEPCPPIQFAAESATNGQALFDAVNGSRFLRRFMQTASRTTRGCILLERPDVLRELVTGEGARDTTGRGTGLAELAAMTPRPSQHDPAREVPEKHWFYRYAKRHWFFGLGSYA
jgi:MoaA/NifB/PqqE/SkfB family radical SAM enzyme